MSLDHRVSPARVSPDSRPPFRALIVDDHADMRQFLSALLRDFCDEVRGCASGEEAVQISGDYRPDLVTMDLQLKDMDGMSAMRVLRSLYPDCQLVVVTHYDGHSLRQRARAAGANHFISKDAVIELVAYVKGLRSRHPQSGQQPA